jgi:hypothetical protein
MNIKVFTPKGSKKTNLEIENWVNKVAAISKNFGNKINVKQTVDSFIKKLDASEYFSDSIESSPYATNMWKEHLEEIKKIYYNNLDYLLSDNLVRYAIYLTVSGSYSEIEIPYLEKFYPNDILIRFLKEQPIYSPTIIDEKYCTSESRVHHLSHLTVLSNKLGFNYLNLNTIVEFGGGYGGMTDLIQKLSPGATQIVIDFPTMFLVQVGYLISCGYQGKINLITEKNKIIKNGMINLLPIKYVKNIDIVNSDLFIATWSLSEANEATQELIVENMNMFNSKYVLYGYRKYVNPNPRQPCSSPLKLSGIYEYIDDSPCFWTLDNDNNYLIAKK